MLARYFTLPPRVALYSHSCLLAYFRPRAYFSAKTCSMIRFVLFILFVRLPLKITELRILSVAIQMRTLLTQFSRPTKCSEHYQVQKKSLAESILKQPDLQIPVIACASNRFYRPCCYFSSSSSARFAASSFSPN